LYVHVHTVHIQKIVFHNDNDYQLFFVWVPWIRVLCARLLSLNTFDSERYSFLFRMSLPRVKKKMKRKQWTEAVKRQVAYAQGYKCAMCLRILPPQWCADHILPLHLNGTNEVSNCQIICPNCHAQKTQNEMISLHQEHRQRKIIRVSRFFCFRS